jgi:hypothetical protein
MADGRNFTDYRPHCDSYPVKAASLWGEHDARQRMINDTESFMLATQQMLNEKNGASKCVDTMVPELHRQVCTHEGCEIVQGHYAGIGMGRIYTPSLAKMASDPQGLMFANTAPLPGTSPIIMTNVVNQCAPGDPETFWAPLAPKTQGARTHPYSAPRSNSQRVENQLLR